MKKIYLLLLSCLLSLYGFSQVTFNWAYVNATGALLSYKTGYTTATVRTDNGIQSRAARRGWAVFDITTAVPAGAVIDSVYLRFNYRTSSAITLDVTTLRGIASDVSTITTPATLYATLLAGTAVCTTNWGLHSGLTYAQDHLGFNAAGITFVQTNLGTIISIGFTLTGTNNYTIIGERGTAATIPQLQIKYHCAGVSSVTAVASPNPVCDSTTLTLTGGAATGIGYSWTGPGGFTAASSVATLIPPVAGIYTLHVSDATGCYIQDTTLPVVVRANAGPVSGPSTICQGTTGSYTDPSALGTWSISPSGIASISATGVVSGLTGGTAIVTYVLTSTGCSRVLPITVNSIPAPISGPTSVCQGYNINLSESVTTGSWSSSFPSIASITPTTGVVSGISVGSTIITYTDGCSPDQYYTVAVNPNPSAMFASASLCQADTITVTDTTTGGGWSTAPVSIATVNATSGLVGGIAPGTATISYTILSTGCYITSVINISPLPLPITGNPNVCVSGTDTLNDAVFGGTWTSSSNANATVSTTGVVSGVAYGSTIISYTNGCGSVNKTIAVDSLPSPIVGVFNTCFGTNTTLSDPTAGGIWISSDTNIAYAAPGLGVIFGDSVGNVNITYELRNGCLRTQNFVVNPLPARLTGTDTACPGTTANLSDITTPGTFSSGNINIATIDPSSGTFTGVNPGTTIITYTLPTGCITTMPILIHPNPLPITGISALCQSLTDTLTDPTPGGIWGNLSAAVGSITAVLSIDTAVYTSISGGTDYVGYRLPTGCLAIYTLTIHPTPAPSDIYNPADSTFYTDTFYVSYQWYQNDTLIPGAVSYNVAGLYNKNYEVIVVDTFGCIGKASNWTLTGINNVTAANEVKIYPNPAGSLLNISGAPLDAFITLTDMSGKQLVRETNTHQMNISSLPEGMYMVAIYDRNGKLILVQKVLKQ